MNIRWLYLHVGLDMLLFEKRDEFVATATDS